LDLRLGGQEEFLERRRVRNGRVESAEDAYGRVQVFERLFLNECGEALADRAGARVLVDEEDAMAPAREREEGRAIQRDERPEIQDRGLDAVFRELLGRARRDVNVGAVRDDREILALAPERGLSERHRRGRFGGKHLLDARIAIERDVL